MKTRKSEDGIIFKSLEKLFNVLNPLQKDNFSISTGGKCFHLKGTKNGIYIQKKMLTCSLKVPQNYKEKHSLPPLTTHSQPQM